MKVELVIFCYLKHLFLSWLKEGFSAAEVDRCQMRLWTSVSQHVT
jgi:hypothetical protein